MNAKEMEGVIKALQTTVQEQGAAIQAANEAMSELRGHQDGQNDTLAGCYEGLSQLQTAVARLTSLMGAETDDGPFYPELKAIKSIVDDLQVKVDGRNKSAPTKRNMTDADALEVLTGQYKELSHKDAAEKIGLTYAQVYSARLEFTFKHVHKTLRDAKWVNPWAK